MNNNSAYKQLNLNIDLDNEIYLKSKQNNIDNLNKFNISTNNSLSDHKFLLIKI